jgi:hypothetical protein
MAENQMMFNFMRKAFFTLKCAFLKFFGRRMLMFFIKHFHLNPAIKKNAGRQNARLKHVFYFSNEVSQYGLKKSG